MKKSISLFILILMVMGLVNAPQNLTFNVTLLRQYPGEKCTSGYLKVDGEIICYTLEKPWVNNEENISSIPAGEYDAILRYDHSDHWRIELLKVPGVNGNKEREHVQIHMGNSTDDTKGCILVGTKLGSDLCSIEAGTSAPAYKKLKKKFYGTENPTSTPNKTIKVKIEE